MRYISFLLFATLMVCIAFMFSCTSRQGYGVISKNVFIKHQDQIEPLRKQPKSNIGK